MRLFRIKVYERYSGTLGDGPVVRASIYLGDEEVGWMTRWAKGRYWCNGIGEVSCHISEGYTYRIFGQYNYSILSKLDEITMQASREKWTMPRAQKALNDVLKAYRKAGGEESA